jgi:hypothetical protein
MMLRDELRRRFLEAYIGASMAEEEKFRGGEIRGNQPPH